MLEGVLNKLEGAVDVPGLGLGEELEHVVCGENDVAVSSFFYFDVVSEELIWDVVMVQVKLYSCWMLRPGLLPSSVGDAE